MSTTHLKKFTITGIDVSVCGVYTKKVTRKLGDVDCKRCKKTWPYLRAQVAGEGE